MLPRLPVLSDANRRTERRWHAYVQRVYGAPLPIGQELDLNTFTFFYSTDGLRDVWNDDEDESAFDAPTRLLRASPCLAVCEVALGTTTYDGTPWIGKDYPGAFVAAHEFGKIGFFVRRAAWAAPEAFKSCHRLEVSHVRSSYKGGEKGLSWLFHTSGSGVFLDCTQLPTRGRVGTYRSRLDFQRVEGQRWENDEGFPRWWMRANSVAMIIFTQADFGVYHFSSGGHASARAEILVLHENEWATELSGGERGVCLNGDGIHLKTFAGWQGERHCTCQPLQRQRNSYLHCDTPRLLTGPGPTRG